MRFVVTLENGIYRVQSGPTQTLRKSLEEALRAHFKNVTFVGAPPEDYFLHAAEVLAPMIGDRGSGTVHEGVASG